MNIENMLTEYDRVEQTHDLSAIENFLVTNLDSAIAENDQNAMITIYNEMIGFYRETAGYEKGIMVCRDMLLLLDEMGLKNTIPYATSLLNAATLLRSAGLLKEANIYYSEVLRIYTENLEPGDLSFASLYNNMALLFEEMGDFESAIDVLKKALGLVSIDQDYRIKQAISHTNLAMCLMKNGDYEEAEFNLSEAFKIFDAEPEIDYHYGAALSAMGEIKYIKGCYEEAADYYERALYEVKKNTGYSKAYEVTLQNLTQASNMAMEKAKSDIPDEDKEKRITGLELSKAYYEEYGISMIREKFPEYEDKIAVGLCGEGSECYGYDDELSTDHDFGPGFCLWIPDELMEIIGDSLEREYNNLPVRYKGIVRVSTPSAGKRVGVFGIGQWYKQILGIPGIPENENEWLFVQDEQLSKATNGVVFRDDLGEFSRIRNGLLRYYPRSPWLKKIANECALVSQYGQYNYSRMMKRGDDVTALICLGEFSEHVLVLTYLLSRAYAPFYKWRFRGIKSVNKDIHDMLSELAVSKDFDTNTKLIEEIASILLKELKNQNLTDIDSTYLDHHTLGIIGRIKMSDARLSETKISHQELVDTLVKLEWEAFDKVENEGGRASCQNNFKTFNIMRSSQYLTWSDEMLSSYINDFADANKRGWNLITEKYGRMEESTAPDKWNEIKDSFPPISDERKAIIENIVSVQTGMMEEFAKEYPKASSNTRLIHTYEDTPFETSYETYLRGEISTYSEDTLLLYGRFIARLAKENINLAKLIIENTALMYGYESVDDMESKV